MMRGSNSSSVSRSGFFEKTGLFLVEGDMNDKSHAEVQQRIRKALNSIKAPTVAELLAPDWRARSAPDFFRAALAGVRCPRALYFHAEGDMGPAMASGHV